MILTFFTISLGLSAATAQALDDAGCKKLLNIGHGVHAKPNDETGELLSATVVVLEEIDKGLGVSGLVAAQEFASATAVRDFTLWLEQNAVVGKTTSGNIVFVKGSAEGGSSVKKTTESITTQTASELLKGFGTPICVDRDMENGMLSVVYGWKPAYASMASDAQDTMQSGGSSPSQKTSSPSIGSSTTLSDDAADF